MDEKEIDKIKSFQWSEEKDNAAVQPGGEVAKQIIECADQIVEYASANVNLEHYDQNHLSIPIPLELHPLLKERFNDEWSEVSRENIFELIRGACMIATDSESYRERLENKINTSIFPPKSEEEIIEALKSLAKEQQIALHSKVGEAHRRYKIEWMRLYDEPSVLTQDGEQGGEIVMEIRLESVNK